MLKAEKHQCEGIKRGTWHRHRCITNGSIERDGKWYCGIHDPVKIAEKRKRGKEKWDEEWTKARAVRRRLEAQDHYCEKLTTEYLEIHQAEKP